MTHDQARSMYRRMMDGVGETVTLRIYSGAGLAQTPTDYSVPARVMGSTGSELVGAIGQADVKLIILHADIAAVSYPLPFKSGQNSKVVVRSKELQIKPGADNNTRRVKGEPIAYDVVAGG